MSPMPACTAREIHLKKMTRHYITLPSTVSTNADLKARLAAADGPVFDVIRAVTQTGGRGRLGRSFFSPPGGLYFSAALPLTGQETNVPCLTLVAGLCVCRALEDLCGAVLRVKWPNDVYLNGKKLCGILCELVTVPTPAAVVGVGVNLNAAQEEIPPELRGKMTSLRAEGVSAPAPEALMKAVVDRLDRAVYEDRVLSDASAAAAYMEQINDRSLLTGQPVSFTAGGKNRSGIFLRAAADGAALVRLPEGRVETVVSGEIVLLP